MIQFVRPIFLWGLVFLTIPLLIHLLSRLRIKKIPFSSVYYLKMIEKSTLRSLKIREILLLLLRTLMLLLIILAFANPVILTDDQAGSLKKREVNLFIDNSLSMQYTDEEGIRLLQAAKDLSRNMVSRFSHAYRFFLIFQQDGKMKRFPVHAENVDSVLKNIAPLFTGLKLKKLAELLEQNSDEYQRHILVIISDFQKKEPWDELKTIKNYEKYYIPLFYHQPHNLSVRLSVRQNGEKAISVFDSVLVSISSTGVEKNISEYYLISMNNKIISRKKFVLGLDRNEIVSIPLDNLRAGWNEFRVILPEDELESDNEVRFSVYKSENIRILVVMDKLYPGVRTFFDLMQEYYPEIRVEWANIRHFRTKDLKAFQGIFYFGGLESFKNDIDLIPVYLRNGNFFVFLPVDEDMSSTMKTVTIRTDFFSAETTLISDPGWMLDEHFLPVDLSPFEGSLQAVPVWFKKIYSGNHPSDTEVFLRLKNGFPVFYRKMEDKGEFYAWLANLHPLQTNLHLSPVFARIFQSIIIRKMNRYSSLMPGYDLAQLDQMLDALELPNSVQIKVTDPSDRTILVRDKKELIEQKEAIFQVPGFYRLGFHDEYIVLAVNYDPQESLAEQLSPDEIISTLEGKILSQEDLEKNDPLTSGVIYLWPYLLAMVILLSAVEFMVAHLQRRKSGE